MKKLLKTINVSNYYNIHEKMGEDVKYVEITYRGIFQKRLAKYIAEGLVYMSRSMGKSAVSFGRYGDSPERNGVPAKYYVALGSVSEEDLIGYSTRVEPEYVDVIAVLDDTLLKGVESWAWQGVQPINLKLREGGAMIVTSRKPMEEVVKLTPSKEFNWTLGKLNWDRSFSGLWAFNDDTTMERVWGAIARVRPDIVDIQHVVEYVKSHKKDKLNERLKAVEEAYEGLVTKTMNPGEGVEFKYNPPRLLTWQEMMEGTAIPAVPRGGRNEQFKRGTTKTERPTVDFDACIKCDLCWVYCPDGCFDKTPEGYYDIAYDYCVGCGICAEVCPVKNCIVMVDEKRLPDYTRPYSMWKANKAEYKKWLQNARQEVRERPIVPGLGR
ncbi:pyruvate synthase subunit PorD [Metallosphaera sedula]|nr:pyruvate synthase subunit PorD [Metallosphaera sedula]